MEAPFIEGAPTGEPPAVDPASVCTANELLNSSVLRPLGVVRGITVRSRNAIVNVGAGFKAFVGGEIESLTKLCEDARKEAFQRMLEEVSKRGGNGVVAVRYGSNCILPGMTEIIAYGMAVTDGGIPAAAPTITEGLSDAWVCTANELPGYTVHRSLGVVQGLTVRTRNAVAKIGAGFKAMAGGEIQTFSRMCEDARQEAYARMAAHAVELGADGVVAMRYDTNEVCDGVTEVLAYGTAVSSTRSAAAEDDVFAARITTSSAVPAFEARSTLGIVRGISVRSNNIVQNLGSALKGIVGGELSNWTALCQTTRDAAFKVMVEDAKARGAKGIVAMRYDCNQVRQGIVEVLAYGTAVTDVEVSSNGTGVGTLAELTEVPRSAVSSDLDIPGHNSCQVLGIARGISVRSVNLLRTYGAAFKSIVGGEIGNFQQMCEQAREEAFQRMLQEAAKLGATGISGMRFQSNDPAPDVVEVIAYGTAVSSVPRAVPAASAAVLDTTCISTTSHLVGRAVQRQLGVVRGITVRSRDALTNLTASVRKTFVGGEIEAWTELCESTRSQAFERLLQAARDSGATGVTAFRYETNEIAAGLAEVIAYGTAVA